MTKISRWDGDNVIDEPDEEDTLTVYITVEVPLDAAVRFENARGVRTRDAFFTTLLASYEQQHARMFPQAGEGQ